MSAECFLDTNILVYGFDLSAGLKRGRALELVEAALEKNTGVISWQVVQEFLNVALHKWAKPLSTEAARRVTSELLAPLCQVFPSPAIWETAIRIRSQTGYHFFDSLIVASALSCGAATLYSEDLEHGRRFGTLSVCNPFL